MSDYSMADIAGLLGATNTLIPKNSTSRAGNTELNMEDFLTLMVVQLQNQTIDDTMDTSEMMNQMIQMQMITAITNMTETNIMTYASSLVGKVVTIGIQTSDGLEEREILVMGTGVSNGQQVIFGSDGETYGLNQIMAVGRLPNEDGSYGVQTPSDGTTGEDGSVSGSGAAGGTGSTDGNGVTGGSGSTDENGVTGGTGSTDENGVTGGTGSTDGNGVTGGSGSTDGSGVTGGTDSTDGTGAAAGSGETPEYDGGQGAPTD